MSIDISSRGISSIPLDLRAALLNRKIFRIQNKATKLYLCLQVKKPTT